MRIGIVGGGVVGRSTARAFLEHCDEVRVHDVIISRKTHSLIETVDCDLVFVCLPTPQRKDSLQCDTSFIELWAVTVKHLQPHANYVLRSTVPVGFTRQVREKYGLSNLVHSPEFLTSRCAATDAQTPARNIIGVPSSEAYGSRTSLTIMPPHENCARQLYELYVCRFPGVQVLTMTSDESETVKLATNSYFALKVAFFNEVYTFCQKMGLDFETVRAGMLSDGRIAHAHTQVPGPDGKLGFGGACLPKDLANFIHCMDHAGSDHLVCASALTYRNDL